MPKDIEGVNYFDQDEVNKINKEERLKRETAEKQNEEAASEKETLLGQIETMKKTAQLTDEQKAQYDKEMENLRQKGLTDAQKQEETITTLRGQVKQGEVDSAKEISNWQNLHHSMLVTNEIMKELGDTEDHTAARQTDPLVALLSPKIIVEKSEDNKYTPIVKDFPVKNEEGKIEKKDISISEAITGLFNTEQYRYLFAEKGKSGTGGDGGKGGDDSDISDSRNPPKDPKRYPAWRAKHIKE